MIVSNIVGAGDEPLFAVQEAATSTRNSPRPQLADLRDSGNIEEEADAVLFLWTPEERPEGIDPLPVNLTLGKNRHGETGEREHRFEKRGGVFVEVSRRDEPAWVRES